MIVVGAPAIGAFLRSRASADSTMALSNEVTRWANSTGHPTSTCRPHPRQGPPLRRAAGAGRRGDPASRPSACWSSGWDRRDDQAADRGPSRRLGGRARRQPRHGLPRPPDLRRRPARPHGGRSDGPWDLSSGPLGHDRSRPEGSTPARSTSHRHRPARSLVSRLRRSDGELTSAAPGHDDDALLRDSARASSPARSAAGSSPGRRESLARAIRSRHETRPRHGPALEHSTG